MRLVILVVCAGCSQDILTKACPLECYTTMDENVFIDPDTAGIGECKAGSPVCDEDNNLIDCVGVVLPTEETCDGRDNNCDGTIDNNLYDGPIWDWEKGLNPCAFRGECDRGNVSCVGGSWYCDYPSTVELDEGGHPVIHENVCDNKDGNCNGLIDDIDYTGRYCYTGPEETANTFPCHPGVLSCSRGQEVCENERTPSAEQCNSFDDNCNGLIDDTTSILSAKFDNVYSFDTSGSMNGEIEATLIATEQYVDTYAGNENFKFALIVMSNPNEPYVILLQDFTDIATFRNVLLGLGSSGWGGEEASYDAIYQVCDRETNVLGLSWRSDAIASYYGFTDMDGSPPSYTSPPITETEVDDMCAANGVMVFQWSYNQSDFDSICDGSNGICFDLSTSYQDILDDMNSIAIVVCEE